MAQRKNRRQPLVGLTLYVEGGGDTRALQASLRRGFSAFLTRVLPEGNRPEVVGCGGRAQALRNYSRAVNEGEGAALLLDSEGPVAAADTAGAHLRKQDHWSGAANDPRVHLMVQVMEAWFLTQPDILQNHFSQEFKRTALPKPVNLQAIAKDKIAAALDKATQNCARGPYGRQKRQAFEILEKLEPGPIEHASPFARRFFEFLRRSAAG